MGHPHTNPLTVFRRSLSNKNWSKKIIIQPFNGDLRQMSHLYDLVAQCDYFIAICGTYWMKYINSSILKIWKKKIVQIDLGLHRSKYPFIKKKFNKVGERKFLYIGNDYSYNNFAKNLDYLNLIATKNEIKNFATIGNKKVGNLKHYGWLDFSKKKSLKIISEYDFLIHTSNFDANPSTVLEAMSWGLIPILTKQCGYEDLNKKCYIPLDDLSKMIKKYNFFQNISENDLKKIQFENIILLKKKYNWHIFREKIKKIISSKKVNKIQYTNKQILLFETNKKKSSNHYMKKDILFSIIKSNIKIFFKNII